MPLHIALLRGINVGGHVVRMQELRTVFQGMGFEDVTTFIASGNVVFAAGEEDARALEQRIEMELARALGYQAATFLRSPGEITRIAAYEAFAAASSEGASLNVVFLRKPAGAGLKKSVLSLGTAEDAFHVKGREVYWLSRTGIGRSLAAAPLAKLVGAEGTTRNLNTVRRLAARYCAAR